MGHIIADHKRRWPGGCVVWRFHPGLSEAERDKLREAMAHWEARADVRFVERTTQSSYVTFKADPDIDNVSRSLSVGMSGGEQFVLVEPLTAEDSRTKTYRHEIGHALGLKHEHQRCDRDDFVTVTDAVKPTRQADFSKLCGADVKKSGPYDFQSIMHYNPNSGAIPGEGPALSGTTPENQTKLDDRASRRSVSGGDATSIAELHGGDAHVLQLTGDGQIEKTVKQYDWTAGWTIATPYLMDVRNYLFLLKQSDGRMHVNVIEGDGSIGRVIDNRDWRGGWTQALKYTILVTNYLLLYRPDEPDAGAVHLHTLDVDGKIGPQVDDFLIEPGWTSIRRFTIGWDNFLHFYNAQTGAWRIRKIKADGRIGDGVQSGTWMSGWTTLAPYSVGGHTFLLRLKASTGTMQIKKFRSDGTLPSTETDSQDWTSGWTTAIPYEVQGKGFLLLLKADSGKLHINRLRDDGTVGELTDQRQFGRDWTVGATYSVGLGNYLLLIKTV